MSNSSSSSDHASGGSAAGTTSSQSGSSSSQGSGSSAGGSSSQGSSSAAGGSSSAGSSGSGAKKGGGGDGSTTKKMDKPKAVVVFELDGNPYALDAALTREVVPIEKLVPVPLAAAPISGLFVLRGASVALVDTFVLFGMGRSRKQSIALVLESGHVALCALTVDRVAGVQPYDESGFTPANKAHDAAQIAGVLATDYGLVTLLDTSVLTRSLERLRP